ARRGGGVGGARTPGRAREGGLGGGARRRGGARPPPPAGGGAPGIPGCAGGGSSSVTSPAGGGSDALLWGRAHGLLVSSVRSCDGPALHRCGLCRGALLRWAAAGLLRRRRQRQRREYQRNQYDRSLCPGHPRGSPAFDRAPIPSPRSHRAPESDATDIDRLWQAGDITMKSEAFWATISSGQADANIMGIMRVIGIAGWSGAGKTTLLAKLIPCLTARGLRVSTVKHAHHAFD